MEIGHGLSGCVASRILAADEPGKLLGQWIAGAIVAVLVGVWALSQVLQKRRIARKTASIAHPRIAFASGVSQIDPNVLPIEAIRLHLGKPPRRFDSSLQVYLHTRPPGWLSRKDDLSAVYREQDRLRREGLVVWASLVQANRLLFAPGEQDHPVSIVWSTDSYFDAASDELQAIGQAAFELKGTQPAGGDAAALAKVLTDERMRGQRLAVPAVLTGGRTVWHSALMCTRRHLPRGVLRGRLLPIWIDPKPTGMALLIPTAYWPPAMRTAWEAE